MLGAFTALSVVMMGLPLAYGKDMQEDKEPLFDAVDTLGLCIAAELAGRGHEIENLFDQHLDL